MHVTDTSHHLSQLACRLLVLGGDGVLLRLGGQLEAAERAEAADREPLHDALPVERVRARHRPQRVAGKVFLTGKEKKPEVSEKRVYRISRKIIGFVILISDEI